MNELIILAMATKLGIFDCGQIKIDQTGDSATIILNIDSNSKETNSPDVIFTVYSINDKGERSIFTQGTVTPGPWIDKTGKQQLSGADPQFTINGIKGKTLFIEANCSKSCIVSSKVQYDTGVTIDTAKADRLLRLRRLQ